MIISDSFPINIRQLNYCRINNIKKALGIYEILLKAFYLSEFIDCELRITHCALL